MNANLKKSVNERSYIHEAMTYGPCQAHGDPFYIPVIRLVALYVISVAFSVKFEWCSLEILV